MDKGYSDPLNFNVMYHLIRWKWRTEGFREMSPTEICLFHRFSIIDFYRRWFLLGIREKLWEYPKNNKPHIFTTPRPLGSGVVKIWGLLFFFKKYKIGNNDFTTILGSVNVKNMTPTTICSSNPTENVLGGRIDHAESSWTHNITSILLTSGVDLIFGFQKQIYHTSGIFKKWISTWSSVLRIGIHRIVTYIYEIYQFFDETY